MHILIATNAFKHSLDAGEAALAIQKGLKNSKLVHTSEAFPIGDGGDGTAALIIRKCEGTLEYHDVHDALGRTIRASFGLIDKGTTAVIEMADASGIRQLTPEERDPLRATSYGTGELMKAALNKGVKKIIIGMGGSATVDGGTGILTALGIRFLNSMADELEVLPRDLAELHYIDLSGLDTRMLNCEVSILCDVDNLLLGPEGSAAIFGPQKGASPQAVITLDQLLEKLAAVVKEQTGKDMATVKYGGTAGGAAAGLFALLNARLVNGIDHFLQLTDFNTALERSALVITGEGSIDEQTLQGKGPFGVAYQAKLKNLPVIAFAGRVPLHDHAGLRKYFDVLMPIGQEPADLPAALKQTEDNLIRTANEVGNLLSLNR